MSQRQPFGRFSGAPGSVPVARRRAQVLAMGCVAEIKAGVARACQQIRPRRHGLCFQSFESGVRRAFGGYDRAHCGFLVHGDYGAQCSPHRCELQAALKHPSDLSRNGKLKSRRRAFARNYN
jgi:hypothetical protein